MDATFSPIDQNVSRYVTFTDDELQRFHTFLERRIVPKKTLMLRAGEKCEFEAYVIKGCLRKYYLDADGNELILQFAIEDSWIGDISSSIYEQQPSRTFIETLEDCELFIISPEAKETLYMSVPKFERVFRILVQRNLTVTQQRLFDTVLRSATDKYLEFIRHYPTLSQRVPQHYIASYLGITPEFLSKIRKRLSRH